MLEAYADITKRLGPPLWWDAHGVPRYDEFQPDLGSEIYADEVVLLDIRCQSCGCQFTVSMNRTNAFEMVRAELRKRRLADLDPALREKLTVEPGRRLADRIRDGSIHYGDPPNLPCCPSGPTMNCEDWRVLQYWHRERAGDWQREPALEVPLPDSVGEQATPPDEPTPWALRPPEERGRPS